MKKNTREDLLLKAEDLFSQNGLYGTSINMIASEVGVSKQALLHYFSSKEKMYAEVLERAKNYLLAFVEQAESSDTAPINQLQYIFIKLSLAENQVLKTIILLMREILDNRDRANAAQRWFMRSFIDVLVEKVELAQSAGRLQGLPPLAFVYQLLGSTQYFVISKPTLKQIYSLEEFESHQQQHLLLIKKWLEV